MALKEYKVRIEKTTYFPIDTLLNVMAGETVRPTFTMKSTIKPKVPMNTLIMAQAGFGGGGQTSFGGMIGFTRTNGFYAAFRSDFNSVKTVGECSDSQKTADGSSIIYEPGKTEKSYLCFTAGYLRRLVKPLYGYVGVGYGSRTYAWLEADTGSLCLGSSRRVRCHTPAKRIPSFSRLQHCQLQTTPGDCRCGYHFLNESHKSLQTI